MSKSLKAIALLLCVSFVVFAVPMLNSAEKKPVRLSLALFVNQPVQLLTTAIPFLNVLFGTESKLAPVVAGKSIVRPTGDTSIGRPGSGD